jgi:hypothetical protein
VEHAGKVNLDYICPEPVGDILGIVIAGYCEICKMQGQPEVQASRFLLGLEITVCPRHDAEYDAGASWCSACAECGSEVVNDYLCHDCRHT